jgi:hypothetical protein
MKLLLISAAALAAGLLGACTTYETPGYSSYGTRVYSDGAYRDDGGYYDRGHYYGGYDERGYAYRQHNRQADAQSGTVVVNQRNRAVSHESVGHRTSATVSHGPTGNKAAASAGGGKHRSDKTSKSAKKTQ